MSNLISLILENWGILVGHIGDYEVRKSIHTSKPRGNTNVPRDGGMTNTKYLKILSKGINHIDLNKTFVIVFSKGKTYGGIVGIKTNNVIRIITVIINKNSKTSQRVIPKIKNRIVINNESDSD